MGKKFDRLAREVSREYQKRGFTKKHSDYIGRATAGKVARQVGKAPRRKRR